jgi:hypothetical protein
MWFLYGAGVIVVLYVCYVYGYYRYSPTNLGNKMLSKYSMGKNPGGSLFYNYDNVQYDAANSRATATMHLRDKVTLGVVSREKYQVTVSPTCSAYDAGCIAV